MEEIKNISGIHKVTINNRRNGLFTGITDVISFDPDKILMETVRGMLAIKGTELHVKRLTLEKGEIEIDGNIDSLTYSDKGAGGNRKGKGESVLKRLFQ